MQSTFNALRNVLEENRISLIFEVHGDVRLQHVLDRTMVMLPYAFHALYTVLAPQIEPCLSNT